LAIKLGSFYGIPIFLDYSGLIIFALIAYTVGFGLMPASYPNLSWEIYLSIGVLSAVILFFSVIVHELAHSIVAKNNGLKIGKITMYLLGGVSEMEEEPPNGNLEFKMSIAGPLTSVAIAVICYLGWIFSEYLHASVLIQGPLYYSYLINAIVAAFNLIPAFPMDGGRVLRSLLWQRNGDMLSATKTASRVGRLFAYGMMFAGVFFIIAIDFFTGFWLILIGWFISSAASSEMNQIIVQQDLSTLKARDMMSRSLDTVGPEITLSELSSKFLEHKHNGFPVMGTDGGAIGCVTVEDLRRVKKEAWNTTFVKDIMTPREKLVTVKETDPAALVVNLMTKNRIGRIFVLGDQGTQIVGIITRSDIMKTVQMQENVRGTKGGFTSPEAAHTIPVERGMMFEIDSPVGNWTPEFNKIEFALVSQNIVQASGGSQSIQFVFEALQKGRFSIILVPQPSTRNTEEPIRTGGIKYTIIVS
jgi:Zn-dependent protease/CBS domain-containing protein